jgi:hypothetical protein
MELKGALFIFPSTNFIGNKSLRKVLRFRVCMKLSLTLKLFNYWFRHSKYAYTAVTFALFFTYLRFRFDPRSGLVRFVV